MKITKSLLFAVALLALGSPVGAQDTRLFSFSLEATDEAVTSDLLGVLSLEKSRTAENKIAQFFIVKNLGNGRVRIASAVNPALFLKRSGNAVVLGDYTEGDAACEWKILYSGYPYASMEDPVTNQVLTWREGVGLTMEAMTGPLDTNNDTSGDHYRFKLDFLDNTF